MSQRLDVSSTSPVRPARAIAPSTVGSWRLLELVGQGEWTDVYRSQPECGVHQVADYVVKILKPRFQQDPLAIRLLLREVLVASQVQHVHLSSVLSHHTHGPPYYLVSPYLVGVSLRATLEIAERLRIPHAFWVARQAAEGLEALHRQGWRHGDIKPENILIGPNGHATLLDLGLAERLQEAGCDNVIKGTPTYMSPESFGGDAECGTASDIYSLGITLYESLTGRCPFVEDSASKLVEAHLESDIPNPRVLVPQIGSRAARLLRAMLAKNPADRPTARQLIDRLVDLEIDTLSERVAA